MQLLRGRGTSTNVMCVACLPVAVCCLDVMAVALFPYTGHASRAAGETEFRALTPAELRVCSAAAQAGGVRLSSLASELGVVDGLHRRGLLYFEVPIRPDDHVSIPPLEVNAISSSRNPRPSFGIPV